MYFTLYINIYIQFQFESNIDEPLNLESISRLLYFQNLGFFFFFFFFFFVSKSFFFFKKFSILWMVSVFGHMDHVIANSLVLLLGSDVQKLI